MHFHPNWAAPSMLSSCPYSPNPLAPSRLQAFFGGYVCANYAYLARVAGLTPAQLAALAANSFRASFLLDAAAKQRHCADVAAVLHEWQAQELPP